MLKRNKTKILTSFFFLSIWKNPTISNIQNIKLLEKNKNYISNERAWNSAPEDEGSASGMQLRVAGLTCWETKVLQMSGHNIRLEHLMWNGWESRRGTKHVDRDHFLHWNSAAGRNFGSTLLRINIGLGDIRRPLGIRCRMYTFNKHT